ncbi:MAG TPA: glycosyltransferase family 39 protein [Candidatus Sulfomarinibacteraceae bacterium]|nr:glycosyltransferase family 39 protein [Candidatus Sulfomarinibacteraceae bacterium]
MATSAEHSSASPALIQDTRALGVLLLFLLNLGLGAWLLHQSPLQPDDGPPLLPFVLIAIAAALLLAAGALTTTVERENEGEGGSPARNDESLMARFRRNEANWRVLLLAAAGVLMAAALYRIPQLDLQDSHALVVAGWAGSILCYLLALAPPHPGLLHRWRERWQAARSTRAVPLVILLGITTSALLLRATFLETIPFTLSGDEASQGLEAVRVLQGEIRNPFTTGWLSVPTLSFYFNSLTIDLLGMTRTGLRLPWALLGTVTVVAAFFLVRRLVGWPLALATSALLATYHYHIHFSRLGSNQIADPLFVALALWFLYRALNGGRGRESGHSRLGDWILTGGSAGIALYFYAGARFTSVVIAAILAYVFLRDPRRFWPRHGRGVLAMSGAFLLVSAPMLQYAVRFPDDFNARLNQVGIIQSGWLERELEAGRQLLPVLWDQFRRAALAFNFYPDRTVWYGLDQPLLDPLFGALFLVGLLYSTVAMWSRSEQRLAPMVAWWWGGMIAGGMLTESPPSSQRLITLSVPVCFFIAVALWQVAHLVQRAIRGAPAQLILGAGVLLFAVSSLQTYFMEYTPQRIYGGQHAELASEMAPQLREMAGTHRAYFIGAPWMYWGFATTPYLTPEMEGQDIIEPLTAPPSPSLVSPERGVVFIILPERRQELPLIQQTFPNGQLREIHSRAPNGQLLGELYIVPPR